MKIAQVRGELLRHGIEEGLDNNEIMLLWHVLDFDFNGKGISWPGRKTIAQRMGYKHERSVTRLLSKLEDRNYLIKHYRTGQSNEYDWTPLIERFQKYLPLTAESPPPDRTVHRSTIKNHLKGNTSKNGSRELPQQDFQLEVQESKNSELDDDLVRILEKCPRLSMVNSNKHKDFWEGLIFMVGSVINNDQEMVEWFTVELTTVDRWLTTHPEKRSKSARGLQSRISNWLKVDLGKYMALKARVTNGTYA